MTRFPGEKRRSRTNKQPLGYPTMNITLTANCQTSQALYNDGSCICIHRSRVQKQKFRAFLKMGSIILYNFSGGYSPIKN